MEHNLVTPWDANINKFLFQMNLGSALAHTLFSKVISFCVGVDSTGEGETGYTPPYHNIPTWAFLLLQFSSYLTQ